MFILSCQKYYIMSDCFYTFKELKIDVIDIHFLPNFRQLGLPVLSKVSPF